MANNKKHKDNLVNFKKGESGNPKGRPKKLVSSILAGLKEEGELVTRTMVEQTYQVLMSLTQSQLSTIANDKEQPMINRIVSKEMLSKKGFEIIEKMMDRANGKATQVKDITQHNTNEIVNVVFTRTKTKPITTEFELFEDD